MSRTYLVHAEVTISIDADSADDAAQLVERHLDMYGPVGVPRGRDDLSITSVEED